MGLDGQRWQCEGVVFFDQGANSPKRSESPKPHEKPLAKDLEDDEIADQVENGRGHSSAVIVRLSWPSTSRRFSMYQCSAVGQGGARPVAVISPFIVEAQADGVVVG